MDFSIHKKGYSQESFTNFRKESLYRLKKLNARKRVRDNQEFDIESDFCQKRLKVTEKSYQSKETKRAYEQYLYPFSKEEIYDLKEVALLKEKDQYAKNFNYEIMNFCRNRKIDFLEELIKSNIDYMNQINIATLLFHSAKNKINLSDNILKLISNHLLNIGRIDAQVIGNSLYGLKDMNSDNEQVKNLVAVLSKKIKESDAKLNEQDIGNALYGLKNMSSESERVKKLIDALTEKIKYSDAKLNAQEIGKALYGLKNMNSDSERVKKLIDVLAEKIKYSDAKLSAQTIGSTLYGLKNMSSNSERVKKLIDVLAKKIEYSDTKLDVQAIGNALYGLKNMSSNSERVRKLINVLSEKIKYSDVKLDAQAIGNALYGLQNMRADNEEIKNLLKVLANKIKESDAKLNAQQIGSALYGLFNMKESLNAQELIDFLVQKLMIYNPSEYDKNSNILTLIQVSSLYKIDQLKIELKKRYEKIKTTASFSSCTEEQVSRLLDTQIQNKGLTEHFYNYIKDGFEMDIFFPKLNLNIELDGIPHYNLIKQYHDQIRDIYLRSQKIKIKRINSCDKSNHQIVQKIKQIVERNVKL